MKGGKGAYAPQAMRKELEKILEDKGFVKELILKETREEAKKAIEAKGVSVTDEEMEEIYKLYSSIYEECKKMSREDLDKIAGGGKGFFNWIKETFVGDPISNKTHGLITQQMVNDAINGVAGKGWDFIQGIIDEYNKDKDIKNRIDMQKVLGAQQESESKETTKRFGIGAAAILGTAYIFKDEIKSLGRSWLGKK